MRSLSRKVVVGLQLLSAVVVAAQTQNVRIPMTHGTSFAGAQVTLPDDLRGREACFCSVFPRVRAMYAKVGGSDWRRLIRSPAE